MNDFETALDQILVDSFVEASGEERGRFDPLEDSESWAFDEQAGDPIAGEWDQGGGDFENLFESDFGRIGGDNFESFGEYEGLEDDSNWLGETDAFGGGVNGGAGGAMLSEDEVEELARDLVGAATPEDMEAFGGKITGGIAKAAGKALGGGTGRKLLQAGSGLLGRALPVVGSSLGTAFMPGVGTAVGGALGGNLKNLLSQQGRQSLNRSLTRQAVSSARRVAHGNPLVSMIARQGGGALRALSGFQAEAGYGDPRVELAKRVVRTVAEAADIASRNDDESDAAIGEAYRIALNRNLPPAVRAVMLTGPVGR